MMRKLFVALLVGAVAVGMAAPAFAADLKFTGSYRVRFMFDENLPCATEEAGVDCTGNTWQTRFRPRFDVETEGGVRGVLRLEIGDVRFGNNTASGRSSGGGFDADGVNVETKWAYIDFPVPATPARLRAGIQPFFLAKGLVLDFDGSGLSLYGKVGELNYNAWWMRGSSDEFNPAGADAQGNDAFDNYAIDLSFAPYRDLNLNLYGLYAHDASSGLTGAGPTLDAWWIGVGAAGKVQNIRWDLDFVYGVAEDDPTTDIKGWVVDGGVGMALPGTPLDLELRGWYATGDEANGGDIEQFPAFNGFNGWNSSGAQIWTGAPVIDITDMADNPQNSWGLGVLARYTATPQLRLTGNLHYIGTVEEGTAADPSPVGNAFLFGVDSVGTEFGLRADYTLYRGLVFTFTASHLLLGDDSSTDGTQFDDVTKIAGVLNYDF